MDNEKNESPFISDLTRNFITVFTLSIIAISLVGFLLVSYAPDVQGISELFASGGSGLSYGVILQIAGFSLMVAFFSVLFISQRFIIKMHFFFRIILLFISAIFTFSIFALIFKWFPANDPLAWLGFLISSFICFIFSLGLTFLKFKLEGKKYNKLLAKYKEANNKLT